MTMTEIANLTHTDFDGGDDDRIFLRDGFRIDVFAPALKSVRYAQMEKKLVKFKIETDKYIVYAWNDSSGYKYWKNVGECNYIQVTASIKNTDMDFTEIQQLKKDLLSCYEEFCEFHTLDEYIATLK